MKKVGFLIICVIIWLCYDPIHPIDMQNYYSDLKKIEVKGAVKNPGVYYLDWNATIEEAIQQAGGLLSNADTSSLNLSKNVENEGVVVINTQKEKTCVSINSATLEELDTLSGIGPSIAQRIIDYRQHSSFSSLEELMSIKGIKQKLYDKIKDNICL